MTKVYFRATEGRVVSQFEIGALELMKGREMKKNLLVATFAAALIALGSVTTSRAQTYSSCTSQCDTGQSSCTLSCSPGNNSCSSACYQANANCRQSCSSLPLIPPPRPTPPVPTSLLPQ
jgi:hypothetical protein